MLDYEVLGALRVTRHDEELHVGGPRQRRLLAVLLLHRNEVVSTDRVVEAVFAGEPTPRAAATLRTYVMRLRKVVEDGVDPPVLETRSPGYVLHAPDGAVDAGRFEHLVAEGRDRRARGDPVGAASAFRAALDTWTGDAYGEFADEAWAAPEAQRLAELRAVTEEHLVDAELACGLAAELVARLEGLVERDPLRESFRSQLMVALYRSGRQADALAVMREHRDLLAAETGLDPSPRLEELAQRILDHDEDLRAPDGPSRMVRGYRLGERLGSGRDGAVHAARLPGVDRDLVIREVPADVADRPDVVRSFDATLRRVSALHHDAIVPIDDHWREPGGAWVVLRRMRGGTLRERLDHGMSRREVVATADRVGSALQALAGVGVTHGRVVPESVLFDDAGAAHLSDVPLGDVAATASDDAVAFAGMVHDALARATDAADDATGPSPASAVLARAMTSEPPPSMDRLLEDLRAAAGDGDAAMGPVANPYKGLRAFDEADAADFFGRERLVDELAHRLEANDVAGRLVLVVGASGSGKSSVVRAGLLPRVRAGEIAGSDRWLVTAMTPGATPFKELGAALGRVATASGNASRGRSDMVLAHDLADEGGLDAALRRIVPAGGDVLLVLDQFEELFTLADEDEQRAFLDRLLHAVSAPDSRLRVVATLRADFYDRPLRFQGFGAVVRDATMTVPSMRASQLEAAITGPAARAGLVVEPALVTELVAAVVDQPAAMPSLQFVLYQLAERGGDRLDLVTYHELGGVGGAIATRAEDLYQSLDDGDSVRRLFEQLVVIGPGGEPTRRPVPQRELAGIARPGIDDVVEPWTAARLLTSDRHPVSREPTIEVAHEALLREWPRLRGWIDASRDAIVAGAQLRQDAAAWAALEHDPGALYRGSKLDVAMERLGGRTAVLPAAAREFLDASRTAREERRERQAERVERQERTNRRLRRQLAALAMAMVLALAGGIVALDQRGEARAQADRAAGEERVAAARELAASSVAVVDDDPELAILLALEALDRTRGDDGTVLPEAESALHRAVTASRIVLRVPGLGGSVDWHPDGDVFVTEGPEESGLVDLRDATTGDSVRSWIGHDADINDVAFSPDGSMVATAGDDGLLRVWDTATGALEAELGGVGVVWGATFSADGARVAAGWVDQRLVRVLDVTTGEQIMQAQASTDFIADPMSFSPDGQQLAVADWSEGVLVLTVATGATERTITTASEATAVSWSPDGRWLAWSAARGIARLSDATEDRQLGLPNTGDVTHLEWSSDSSSLATGGRDGTARVWDVTGDTVTEVLALTARADQGAIGGLAFSQDGRHLLTGDVRVTAASIWDVGIDGGAELGNIPTSSQVQGTGAFLPGGDVVVTGTQVPAVEWRGPTWTPRLNFGSEPAPAVQIAVSPDGALLATLDFHDPPRVRVWDRQTGAVAFTVEEPDVNPQRIAWSPDGELLAVSLFGGAGPGTIRIVDRAGRPIATIAEDPGFLSLDLAFLPDGRHLVAQRERSDRQDPTIDGVRVWDWRGAEPVVDIPVYAAALAVSPTGTSVAVAEVGLSGSVWDATTAGRLATLTGHTGDITDLAWSADGQTIATSGRDGTVRLWSAEDGTERLVLHGHTTPVWSVDFGPEGDELVSTGPGLARVWALDLDELIGIAEDRLTRSLTDAECRQYLHVEACPA